MARVTIDLTIDSASPADGQLPAWTEAQDDGDVVLRFGDVELRMTDPQFVALLELAGKFQGIDPFTGEELAPEPLAEATTVVQRDDVDGNFIDPPRMAVPRAQPGQRLRVAALPE